MQASLKFATEPTRTIDALTATNTSSFTATTQSTDVDALTHGNVNAAAARGGVGEEEMDVNVLRDEIMCDIVDALE